MMKLAGALPLLFSIGVATATKVSPRGLASSGTEFCSQSYDYLVVGGGTAGLVVAARLSEDPNVSVGVIEAGRYLPDDPLINTPASAFDMQGKPQYDWLFRSTSQPHLKDRTLDLARGKVLGGSSAINGMVINRAFQEEYDAWTTLGNPGWDWKGLLPYMKAAEHFTGIDPFRLNYTNAEPDDIFPSQGTKGPIAASYNSWYSDVTIPYGKAITNLGIPANFNPDSGNPFGLYNTAKAVNTTTGRRSYAATTYYAYNAHRPNLVVLTGAQATKIDFKDWTNDKKSGKITATGVSFVHNSTTFSVSAKQEVILSAGTFQTPQLLELSGIGNSRHLRQLGINPLVDLPSVGENLQEHLVVSTVYELKPGVTTMDILRNNATYAATAQAQYNSTHDGILTSTGSILSFIDLDFIASPKKIANMTAQLSREIGAEKITPLQKAQYAIQKDWLTKDLGQLEVICNPVYNGAGVPKVNTSYVGIVLAIQHPFSRGSVHINSSNPLAPPQIDPKYFSKTFDQDVFVQGVKFAQKVSETEPLASLIVARDTPAPGVTSDADIIDFIKTQAQTIYHPIGTAALAPKALGGVVDTNLIVYGTRNLRVVDASIMPLHISAHISRTVYGIAEKGSAIIKKSG